MSIAYLGDFQYHEQYKDAVNACIADQTTARLNILTGGNMRFEIDIGEIDCFRHVYDRMAGDRRFCNSISAI